MNYHDNPPEWEEQDLAGRIRAARAYANLSRAELVQAVARKDLTQKTLVRLETVAGANVTGPQLAAIAKACNLPATFFTVDFNQLNDPLTQILASLDDVAYRLTTLESRIHGIVPRPKVATKPSSGSRPR